MYNACKLFKLCSVTISIVQRIFYKNTTKTFCKELLIVLFDDNKVFNSSFVRNERLLFLFNVSLYSKFQIT